MADKRALLTRAAVLSLFTMGASGGIINPGMQQLAKAFPTVPLATILLLSTVPALVAIPFTALSGAIAGRKVGFRQLAWAGLTIIVVAGATPYFLHSFSAILICRGLLGAGLGLMSPLGYSLVLRLFAGGQRANLMGLGNACMNIAAVVFQLAAGMAAAASFRYVFPIYLVGVLPLAMLLWVPEPKKVQRPQGRRFSMPAAGWAYAAVGGILVLLYQPIVLLTSTLFDVNHIGSAAIAGAVLSVTMVGYAVGSTLSGPAVRRLGRHSMPVALAMMAVGSGIYAFAGHLPVFVGAALVGGIGFGLIYPALMNRIGGIVPLHAAAGAISVFTVCVSLGVFLIPYYLRLIAPVTPGFVTILTFPMLVGAVGLAILAAIFALANLRAATRAGDASTLPNE